jgi:hypothetical protein
MVAIHKHRYPAFWLPKVVPREPVELDRSHPLARGLISLWVPGISFADLTGGGPRLTSKGAHGYLMGTPNGVGISSLAGSDNGLGSAELGNATAAGTPYYARANTNIALVHHGFHVTTSGSSGAGNAPYLIAFGNFNGTAYGLCNLAAGNGDGLTLFTCGGNVQPRNQFPTVGYSSCVGMFPTGGGTGYIYVNGKFGASTTGLTSFVYPTANHSSAIWLDTSIAANSFGNVIGLSAAIYDTGPTPLSDDTIAWLHNEPWAHLRPVAKRVYYMPGTIVPTPGAHVRSRATIMA